MRISSDFDKFTLISQGHAAFEILWAGVELKVFEILNQEKKIDQRSLVNKLNLKEVPGKILCSGLMSLGLIKRENGFLENSELVKKYLIRESPENMIDALGWQKYIVYPGIVDFVPSLKANKNIGLRHFPGNEESLYARLAHDPKLENVFQEAMSSLSQANNQLLSSLDELNDIDHLVDAGGGDATNAICLAESYPELRLTVFDLDSVCDIASKNIKEHDLQDRIGVYPGDLFHTDFPSDIDGVLLSHMLTIWSPEKNVALLKRIYEALPSQGKVFVFNMMMEDTEDGPISTTLGSVYFLTIATGQGRLYTWVEQEGFLKKAGFHAVKRIKLPRDHGILIGYK